MTLACVELITKLSYKYTKKVAYVRMSRNHNRRKVESIQENCWWLCGLGIGRKVDRINIIINVKRKKDVGFNFDF